MALKRDEFAQLLKDPSAAAARTGRFVCFQMIPIEERIGQWRFAGTAENLASAFERCGGLFNRIWPREEDELSGTAILLDMLDALDALEVTDRPWSSNGTPQEFELPFDATLIVLAEGGAPHDDIATAIFEVKDWGTLRERRIEDQPPPTPFCSAYVLEFYGSTAKDSDDVMGVAFVEREVSSLRTRFEAFRELPLRYELSTAIASALEGADADDFAFRVWTVQRGVSGAPLDVKRFVSVTVGGTRSTLDALDAFENDGAFPTEDLSIEVMWDAIESALQPLQSPLLEPEGELGFENESRELEWFTAPLTLGENIIEP
jgi:hypothetical protein